MKEVLAKALGILAVVRKTRTLFMVGQTRVYLDEVDRLGQFLELEVVLRPQQSEADGGAIAESLMATLRIEPTHLIPCAYVDLLASMREGEASVGQ